MKVTFVAIGSGFRIVYALRAMTFRVSSICLKKLRLNSDVELTSRLTKFTIMNLKFLKNPVGIKIIEEMEEKRKRLCIPKNFSIRPILIHVNGVEDSVLDEGYFDKVIDFGQLLESGEPSSV